MGAESNLGGWLVAAPLVVSILGGAVSILAGRTRRGGAIAVEHATVAAFCAAVALLAHRVYSTGATATVNVGSWPEPVAISLVADGAAVVMLAIVAVVAAVATAYRSRGTAGSAPRVFLLAGAAGAVLAGDLFNLYVWFELTILSSVGVLASAPRTSLRALRQYLVANLIASALLLTGVGLVYGATGTVDLASIGPQLTALDPASRLGIAGVVVVALAVKAGAFPAFSWLARAYATLPPADVAMFSAVLTKLAVYALARLLAGPLASSADALQSALIALACATMVAGVLCALAQMDLRRLLAFHIVSQVGYLLLAVAIDTAAGWTGLFVFLVHVCCAKAALFLLAGLVARDAGSYDLSRLGGLVATRPVLAAMFAVAALALAGLPPLSGFWGKLLIVYAALAAEHWWAAGVALGVSALTLLSMVKVWMYAFWRDAPARPSGEQPDCGAAPGRAPTLATAALVAVTVAAGVLPAPVVAAARRAAADIASGGML